jgi:class 3 adenylate cyclase
VPVGFITGQLQSQRKHAAAGRLVIELGRVGAPGELEAQLRDVLGDSTLTVLHWSQAAGAYLDAAGRPVPLPAESEPQVVTFLEREGRPMTVLLHRATLLDDPDLVETVRAAVGFVIEKERRGGRVWGSGDPAALPTGFVTIMFTDIEGSTALLQQLGDRYAAVLDDVRDVIRGAVLRSGGREVEVRADEFFGVFERVAGAVEAAVTVQRTLGARSWPDDLPVRVRIGLHSGLITLTDGGYIGLSVHTAARICSAGHGGQIVVSDETRAAVEEAGGRGLRFRTLGPHHLAGLGSGRVLFQVEAEGLLADFPPLR